MKSIIDKQLLFFCGLVSLFLGLLFISLVTHSTSEDVLYYFSSQNGRNLQTYTIAVTITILSFFISCRCFKRKLFNINRYETLKLSKTRSTLLLIVLICVGVILLFDLFLNNEDNFYGYALKYPLWFIVPLITFLIYFFYFLILNEKNSKYKKYGLFALYGILAFLNAVKYTHVNTFSSFFAYYHCNAVSQTIYNVHFNTPFNELTSGIYGHYALFFKPFTTIWGANPISIAVIIGIIGFLTSIFSFATMHLIIKSDTIKVISAVAIAFHVNVVGETYWQTRPIRWFFPSIILLFITLCGKKQIKIFSIKNYIQGFLICSLAILWETESGIFVALVWAFFCILRFITVKGFNFIKIVKLVFVYGISFIAEIFFALGLMNIYNLCVGGTIEKRAFFFPLFTEFASTLQTELKFGNMYYVYAIAVFLCCLLWSFVKTFYYNKADSNYKVCSIAAISLMGLAMLTYYMNRTISDIWGSIHVQIIMCICILADASISSLKNFINERKVSAYEIIKIATGTFSIGVLSIIVLLSAYTLPKAEERFKRGDYDVQGLYELKEEIKTFVPKNTYAIGIGTTDIYGMLGWDTQYHMRDIADLGSGGRQEEIMNAIKNDLSQQNDVFVGTGEYPLLSTDFKLIKEFNFYEYTYGYFHRNNMK